MTKELGFLKMFKNMYVDGASHLVLRQSAFYNLIHSTDMGSKHE